MAPAGQYVFAEMLRISEHFTAGSHEWLPYSKDEVLSKCSNTDLSLQSCFPYHFPLPRSFRISRHCCRASSDRYW